MKNIIKKKSSYLMGLKALTNWIFSNRRDQEELENNIIQKYKFDTTLLKRLISYVYNCPHIVWYINKHMNHLFDFDKMDLKDMIYSFVYLLDVNQYNQVKKLFYLKSDDLADKNKTKIKQLLKEFFNRIYDKNYNEQELNFFYDLFNLGIITVEDIHQVDLYLNNTKNTIDIDELTPLHYNNIVLDIYRVLPEKIQKFCNEIKEKILSRRECQTCELFGKSSVILDTNVDDFGEVDIVFIGLNPGKDEVKLDKPFVGKSGMFLRKKIAELPGDIKWVITNCILCHTKNEKDIKNAESVIFNCYDLVLEIASKFPAKYYIPLGSKALKLFGIEESISSASGKKFITSTHSVIPLIHPSSAVNYGQLKKFEEGFATIYEQFKSKRKTVVVTTPSPIAQDKFITEITPDLTLFDIREVDNKIIKIFIDKDSKKKYLIEDYNFEFYVKMGNWTECSQIVDQVDYRVVIPGYMKAAIIKQTREKVK